MSRRLLTILSGSGAVLAPPCSDESGHHSTSHRQYHEVRFVDDGSVLLERNSILLLPNMLSSIECELLMRSAEAAAQSKNYLHRDAAAHQSDQSMTRVRIEDMDNTANELSRTILMDRLIPFLEQEVPQAADTLFGQHEGLRSMHASFSGEEPCVNIYSKGGEFSAHEDGYQVTVNVLLSDPSSFEGGGTSFWPEGRAESGGCHAHVQPEQGMAVVFNGEITHAGRAVVSGRRLLYVASFDLEAGEGQAGAARAGG